VAIPNPQGDHKLDSVDFDIVHNLFGDTVMFNCYERFLAAKRSGELLSNGVVTEFAYSDVNYNEKSHFAQAGWYRKLSEPFSFLNVTAVVLAYTDMA